MKNHVKCEFFEVMNASGTSACSTI